MISKVLSEIRKKDMIKAGDRVTVGLSGGADSVALLCILKQLENELGIAVSACHVNHNLRGEESDRDQEFCRQLCEVRGIPFETISVDVIGFCSENGLSTEEGARRLRYQAFESLKNTDKIATAHTMSDNAETVIINLSRGSSIDGLCGIPPVRGNIIRPLLCCSRKQIEDYLKEMNQEFVTDSSNLTDNYRRNKIRHNVIPVLKDFNDSLEETIARNSEVLREEKELLASMAEELENKASINNKPHIGKAFERFSEIYPIIKKYDVDALQSAPKPIRLRVIRKALSEFGISYDFSRLSAIDEIVCSGGTMDVGGRVIISNENRVFSITKSFLPFEFEETKISIKTDSDKKIPVGDKYSLILKTLSDQEIKLFVNKRNFQFKNAIDCDRINDIVTIRKRKPGDGFEPVARGCRQSFKNLLNAVSMPMSVRDSLVVIEDLQGIIWFEGFFAAQRAALTVNTQRAILPIILEE